MRVPEQVSRIALVAGAFIALALVVRFVIIPRSYFDTTAHQRATVRYERARPVIHGGAELCRECHTDVYDTKSAGYHRTVACETCHGPSAKHAEDPTAVQPFAPRDRKFCPVCHAYDSARPTGFPQINPAAHNPLQPCITCHNPHDPVPPETPRDCSACHAQIARTKALSSHALLSCETCHQVAPQHWTAPRQALPSKPSTRAFCGGCHAAAANAAAPQIDIDTHGTPYLCWQCHYPHLPEGAR